MAKSVDVSDDAELLASVRVEVRGREVEFTIEYGDAMRATGDVLLLKYAQASYGLDLRVFSRRGLASARSLAPAGVRPPGFRPP